MAFGIQESQDRINTVKVLTLGVGPVETDGRDSPIQNTDNPRTTGMSQQIEIDESCRASSHASNSYDSGARHDELPRWTVSNKCLVLRAFGVRSQMMTMQSKGPTC